MESETPDEPLTPASEFLLAERERLGVDDLIMWVRSGGNLVSAATTVFNDGPLPVDMPIGSGIAGSALLSGRAYDIPDLSDVAALAAHGLAVRQPDVVASMGWVSAWFKPLDFPPSSSVIAAYSRKAQGASSMLGELQVVGERALLRLNWDKVAERPLRLESVYYQISDYIHDTRQYADAALMNVQALRDGSTRANIDRAVDSLQLLTSLCRTRLRGVASASLPPRTCNISAIVSDVIDQCSGKARQAGVVISRSIDDRVPGFVIEQSFRRAVTNLISNSISQLEAKRESRRLIEVMVVSAEGFSVVRVSDNGPGVQPDRIARIFEPGVSYSTDGVGLGLAQAESAVAAVGGTIKIVWNEFGKGVAFELSVPRRKGSR